MMKILPKTNIDFLKYRKFFFALSAVIFVAGFISLFTKSLNYGIEFTGGTLVQAAFTNDVSTADVRSALSDAGIEAEIQSFTDANAYAIRTKDVSVTAQENEVKVRAALDTLNEPYIVEKSEFVGPAVGKDMSKRAILALAWALALIVLYVAFRFHNIVWGASGVIGILHDVLICVFAFSFLQLEVDLVIVAAFLTVAGFSINDTIVIFDRMRERIKNNPKEKMYDVINNSLNETLSRTVITSCTVLSAVIIFYFMGGEVLKNFSLAMVVGCISGVYSTLAIATPLVYQWSHAKENAPSGAAHNSGAALNSTAGVSSYKAKKNKKAVKK